MSNYDEGPPKLRLKYWFKRALSLLNREPQNINELIDVMKDMQGHDIIKADILNMMQRIAILSETKVADVMLERSKMITITADANFETVLSIVTEAEHSRYPVFNKGQTEVIGILLAKDLLDYFAPAKRPTFSLQSILRSPAFIGENKPLDILLRDFRKGKNHLAIVLDQYEEVAGLVTLEDVLEQIVGNISDEHDEK